jgi:hypothetical protein
MPDALRHVMLLRLLVFGFWHTCCLSCCCLVLPVDGVPPGVPRDMVHLVATASVATHHAAHTALVWHAASTNIEEHITCGILYYILMLLIMV